MEMQFSRATRIENLACDGQKFAFSVKTSDGRSVDAWMPLADFGDVVTQMLRTVTEAPTTRPFPVEGSEATATVYPVMCRAIGSGQSPAGLTFVADLGGFDLTFATSPSPGSNDRTRAQ